MNAQLLYIFVNSPLVKVHCRHLVCPNIYVKLKKINELASSPVFNAVEMRGERSKNNIKNKKKNSFIVKAKKKRFLGKEVTGYLISFLDSLHMSQTQKKNFY